MSDRGRKCPKCGEKVCRVRVPGGGDVELQYLAESEVAVGVTKGGLKSARVRVWRLHTGECVPESAYRPLLRPARRLPGKREQCPKCAAPTILTPLNVGQEERVDAAPVARLTFSPSTGHPLVVRVHRRHGATCRALELDFGDT